MTDEPERRCRWCRHSEGTYIRSAARDAIVCRLHGVADPEPCNDYEREPGADDE